MIEKSTVTRCARRAVRGVGRGAMRMMWYKANAHRQNRHAARQAVNTCLDFDALDLSPKRLTGWDIT